jgi:hypothetical protein
LLWDVKNGKQLGITINEGKIKNEHKKATKTAQEDRKPRWKILKSMRRPEDINSGNPGTSPGQNRGASHRIPCSG